MYLEVSSHFSVLLLAVIQLLQPLNKLNALEVLTAHKGLVRDIEVKFRQCLKRINNKAAVSG